MGEPAEVNRDAKKRDGFEDETEAVQ